MINKRFLSSCLMLFTFTLVVSAQPLSTAVQTESRGARQVPEVTLEATGVPRPTNERLDAVMAPVVCDPDHNLYFRRVGTDAGSSPLIRMSPTGGQVAVFDANKLPGVTREVDVLAFTVDEMNRVHKVVRVVEGKGKLANYIVVFSKDGELVSKIRLVPEFMPYAFAAMDNGDYFMSGIGIKKTRDDIPRSLTGVIDSSGRLKSNLKIKADDPESPIAKVPGGSEQSVTTPSPHQAIENGASFYGSDRNVYLFRASDPVQMKVINPAGELVREQQLRSPFDKAEPFEFRLGANRILIGFRPLPTGNQAPGAPVYTTFDRETGEPIINYRFGESIRGALGCFTGDRLTFLTGTRDGRFAILEAKPN